MDDLDLPSDTQFLYKGHIVQDCDTPKILNMTSEDQVLAFRQLSDSSELPDPPSDRTPVDLVILAEDETVPWTDLQ